MRSRTTLLLLLACLFAVIPTLGFNRNEAACAQRYGVDPDDVFSINAESPLPCSTGAPREPLDRALVVMSVLCLAAGIVSAGKSWRDRQQDRALLRGAGFALDRNPHR